jgi:hypothetical protein
MALIDLHDWPLTALVALLLAVSLALQGLPTGRSTSPDTAVCEKPGLATLGFVLSLH